jgi:hypothetical protein
MTWMKWQFFIVATLQLMNITVDNYHFLIGFYQSKASTMWKTKCLELLAILGHETQQKHKNDGRMWRTMGCSDWNHGWKHLKWSLTCNEAIFLDWVPTDLGNFLGIPLPLQPTSHSFPLLSATSYILLKRLPLLNGHYPKLIHKKWLQPIVIVNVRQ